VIVLHAPEPGAGGHVHYVETGAVAHRLQNGNLRPDRPCELSKVLVDALST
jgi:hypothetical protein